MSDGEGAQNRAGPRAWWALAVLTLLYTMSLMDRLVIALMFTPMKEDLGISDFQLGLMHGLAFALFFVVFGMILGWASDRYSRRWLIFVGVSIWSVATAFCGLAATIWQLVLARFAVGAGEAALNPSAYSILSDEFPPAKRGLAFSVYGAGSHAGVASSLLLGGLLFGLLPRHFDMPFVGEVANWQGIFIFLGLPGILIGCLIWTLRDPPRRECLDEAKPDWREALAFAKGRWRFLTGHFLGFALLSAMANGYSAWTPSYLVRNFHLTLGEAATMMASISVAFGILGTIVSGIVADRMMAKGRQDAHVLLFAIIAAVQIVILTLAALAPSIVLLAICQAVFVFLTGFTGVAVAAIQLTTPNQYRGQISAAYLFVFSLLGYGVGPTLIGAIATYGFADDLKLGWAIAVEGWILLPIAVIALASAMRPMRSAMSDALEWRATL
ncbi:spinster family MFS transporter [Sphingomonas crocodyli]|uniref:MFS transporter n=1 Tax=Sphingomonas crocodyli TaxID=1979270 RepID=A0A437M688_9SPHN|nr:MFS transporter [Sphingomonas crocodyli]RVT93228.1 MFS transporter [Sphingomonas crocodyli]